MEKIQIGGKDRPVLFRLRAIRLYQELTGHNLLKENIGEVMQGLEVDKICALVYVALVCGWHEDNKEGKPDFELSDVEQWMDLNVDILATVVRAYADMMPKKKEVE